MIMKARQQTVKNIKDKKRSAEILGVFAKHNFYINGFTPEELRTTLEDLGPTYVKIGQIISSRSDMLPESYLKELAKLRSNVKPLEALIVRGVIEEEIGKPINEIYREFRDEPLGSASIAQAHYGVLMDGTRVVTKVQRPGIAQKMRSDFVLLKKLAKSISAASEEEGSVDLKSVIEELEAVSEEELDFRVEACNTRQFREHCIEDETVVSCPRIIDELTTERILTQTYVDGFSIGDRARIEEEGYSASQIAETIIDNYLHQVLDAGLFHGDPHQGNIMISGGIPYFIDFGMIGHISSKNIDAVTELIFALMQKDADAFVNAALCFGKVTGDYNRDKLVDEVDRLIEKYTAAGSLMDIDMGGLMSDVTTLLAKYHIKLSAEYTMFIRSLVTIEGVIEKLCPEINLFEYLTKKMLKRAKDNFDAKELLQGAIEQLTTKGLTTVRLPGLVLGVLKNLVKGKLKIGFEITGYEEPVSKLAALVKDVIFALFSCVMFAGSCTLCTTDIRPLISNGMPLIAAIGFVISVALAIFTIKDLVKR